VPTSYCFVIRRTFQQTEGIQVFRGSEKFVKARSRLMHACRKDIALKSASQPFAAPLGDCAERLQLVLGGQFVATHLVAMPLDRQRLVEHEPYSAELPIEEVGLLFVPVDPDFHSAAHLNALLVLDVSLDNGDSRPAHRRNEIAVDPKRRKTGFQPGKFLSWQRRGWPLNSLNHAMHSELRIDIKQNVNVLGHDLALKQRLSVSLETSTITCLRPYQRQQPGPGVGISGKTPRGTCTKKQPSGSIDNPSVIR
jgi:hypothetical protein